MAWDAKTSPWDWDTRAVLLQGHGGYFRKRTPESIWATSLAGHDGLENGEVGANAPGLGTSVTAFSSASATTKGSLATGVSGEKNSAVMNHRRPAIVATSTGEDNPARWTGREDWKSAAGFLELRSSYSSACSGQKNSERTSSEVKDDLTMAEQHHEEKSMHGRLFLSTEGSGHDMKEGTRADEQHSSTATGSSGSGDSFIGLHLGKRAYFEDGAGGIGHRAAQKPSVNNPPPPKKPRGASGGLQTPRCQVEGCKTDLTSAKDYHRRHKVCEVHSKAGKVIVAHQEQRFCQQCSRFHVLAEFDEVKRSCRRRLACHNERRRKPHPNTLALNGRLPTTFPEWLPFVHHQRFNGISSLWEDPLDFRSFGLKGVWPSMVKLEEHPIYDGIVQAPGMEKQLFFTGRSPHTNDKLLSFHLDCAKEMVSMPNDMSCQKPHQYFPGSVGPQGNGLTLSSPSCAGVLLGLEVTPAARVTDSGCALSLLSQGAQAPNEVTLDLSTQTTITVDQFMAEDQTAIAQHSLDIGHQHHFDNTMEKMLSITSNSRGHTSASIISAGSISSMEMDHYPGSFINGVGSFENNMFLSTLQGHESSGPEDVRPTIDLMRISSPSLSAPPPESSVAFELGGSPFRELQYSYESSFFDPPQRM